MIAEGCHSAWGLNADRHRKSLNELELVGSAFEADLHGWSHISLSGDYLWEQAAQVGGDFRLLRIEDSPISQVA